MASIAQTCRRYQIDKFGFNFECQHIFIAPKRGFTLLEMMLTVGLIALTATFVTANIGQSNSQLVSLEAKRFVALMNVAQDESIMTGQPIKLKVEASENRYQFMSFDAVNSVPNLAIEEETDSNSDGEYKGDSFLRPRDLPKAVQMTFIRKPKTRKKTKASKFVPDRVHEILNESILDKANDVFEDEQDEQDVLIEPNGLISPFTLSLQVENQSVSIELDRYGKAAIVEDKK